MQLAEAAPLAAAWLLARGSENHLSEAWPLLSEARGEESWTTLSSSPRLAAFTWHGFPGATFRPCKSPRTALHA